MSVWFPVTMLVLLAVSLMMWTWIIFKWANDYRKHLQELSAFTCAGFSDIMKDIKAIKENAELLDKRLCLLERLETERNVATILPKPKKSSIVKKKKR